jgi:hypothetical protein
MASFTKGALKIEGNVIGTLIFCCEWLMVAIGRKYFHCPPFFANPCMQAKMLFTVHLAPLLCIDCYGWNNPENTAEEV